MGDYHFHFTIPKNTPLSNPVELKIEIEGEVLDTISYLIPSGWQALAHFAVFYGQIQIWPEIEGEWVTGDNLFKEVPIKWPIPDGRAVLTLRGYNEDDTYDHTVYISFFTTSEEVAKPYKILSDFIYILKKILRIG